MMPITLPNGRKIGPDQPCFMIAEIGQNHNGDIYTATRLLKVAHDAGVDAVKFCKRHIPSDLTRDERDRPYEGPQSFGATYGEHREALELSIDEYKHLVARMAYNEWPEIFFATACDKISVDELEEHIDPPLYKVASRDLDNLPLLRHIAKTGKPVILSTGMASLPEIEAAVNEIERYHDQIIVLVCTSEYPTPDEHVGLWRLIFYGEYFKVPVGLSDHTPGIVAAQTAAAMGACVIEKHITLARAMKGTDHAASLEPDGINRLVRNVRAAEAMQRWDLETERNIKMVVEVTRRKLGRSIVAARDIRKGEIITEEDLCLKSPGTGMPWACRSQVIDHVASCHIKRDSLITELMIRPAAVTLQATSPEYAGP